MSVPRTGSDTGCLPYFHRLIQLDWLARNPVSASLVLGLQVYTAVPGFLHECLRSELKSSCVLSKHFTD